jgi:hypothetical protein
MLEGMRFTVELPDEDETEAKLRTLANLDLRGFKQQASYYLYLKIQEDYARRFPRNETVAELVEGVA